jgi:heme oxygenase
VARLSSGEAIAGHATICQQLRDGTSDLHARIELNPRFRRLMAADLERGEYIALLGRLLGFHGPFETALHMAAALLPAGIGLGGRLTRCVLLHRDLLALGRSAQEIAALPMAPMPRLAEPEAVWGTLYVIEGSSLGGQIVARRLSATSGLGPENGAGYHTPYGSGTGAMWLGFKAALEHEYATGRLDPDVTVAWARRTFATLDAWVAG